MFASCTIKVPEMISIAFEICSHIFCMDQLIVRYCDEEYSRHCKLSGINIHSPIPIASIR